MKKIWLIGLFLITILSINSFLFAQEETATFSKELTSESLYEEGIKLCEQKKYKEAISYFEEATKRKANFAEAYYQIGFCYLKTREDRKSVV